VTNPEGASVAEPLDPPLHDPRTHDDDPTSPEGSDDGPRSLGFEHLGWTPGWRERVDAVVGGAPPGRLAATAAVGLVVLVVVGIVVLRGPTPPPPERSLPITGGAGDPGASTTTTATTFEPAEVVVHAAGAVVRPGVYRLAAGARIADLLDVAGGPVTGADLDRLNLAALLEDGGRTFVPLVGQDVPAVTGGSPPSGQGAEGADDGPIDLNTASLAELDTLPGVGPATAQAILDERERRGGFGSVEELLDVRGIGEAKLEQLRPLVTV